MRAFLIPHASPHNSHANRISRASPRRKVERTVQEEKSSRRLLSAANFCAHNASGSCGSSPLRVLCGHKFATIKYRHESESGRELLFRQVRAHRDDLRMPRGDRKKDPPPRRHRLRRRRNRVFAFAAQISEYYSGKGDPFSFIHRGGFLAFLPRN